MTQAMTARMTSVLVLTRRRRRLLALPREVVGTVTVPFDPDAAGYAASGQAILPKYAKLGTADGEVGP